MLYELHHPTPIALSALLIFAWVSGPRTRSGSAIPTVCRASLSGPSLGNVVIAFVATDVASRSAITTSELSPDVDSVLMTAWACFAASSSSLMVIFHKSVGQS
jgi:hypothetical protein